MNSAGFSRAGHVAQARHPSRAQPLLLPLDRVGVLVVGAIPQRDPFLHPVRVRIPLREVVHDEAARLHPGGDDAAQEQQVVVLDELAAGEELEGAEAVAAKPVAVAGGGGNEAAAHQVIGEDGDVALGRDVEGRREAPPVHGGAVDVGVDGQAQEVVGPVRDVAPVEPELLDGPGGDGSMHIGVALQQEADGRPRRPKYKLTVRLPPVFFATSAAFG